MPSLNANIVILQWPLILQWKLGYEGPWVMGLVLRLVPWEDGGMFRK